VIPSVKMKDGRGKRKRKEKEVSQTRNGVRPLVTTERTESLESTKLMFVFGEKSPKKKVFAKSPGEPKAGCRGTVTVA